MDFFQRVGNFFTGAGWVTDEEERRKKRQQQRPKPQPRTPRRQPQIQVIDRPKPGRVTVEKPKNNGFFNLQKPTRPPVSKLSEAQKKQVELYRKMPEGGWTDEKSVVPGSRFGNDFHWAEGKKIAVKQDAERAKNRIPVGKAASRTIAAPAKVQLKQPTYSDDEARNLKALYQQGKVDKNHYVRYTRERANRANKAMTNGRVSASDFAKAVVDTGKKTADFLILDDIRTAREQNKVSTRAKELANDGNRLPLSMRLRYREDPKTTRAIKKAEQETGIKYDMDAGQAAGLGVLSNFIGTSGLLKGIKYGAETGVKTAVDTADDAVGALQSLIERAKGGSREAIKEAADITSERTRRINQRNADEALAAAEKRTTDNTPSFQKERVVEDVPAPEQTALAQRQAIQQVINEESAKAEQYINSRPELTDEQRQAVIEATKQRIMTLTKELQEQRQKTVGVVDDARKQAEAAQAARQATVKNVQEEQAQRAAPVDQRPEGVDPEFRINNTYDSYANRAVDEAGKNREDGLVKGNALYNNPLTKLYNKAQQGWVNTVDEARTGVNDLIQEGVQSENAVTAAASNLPKMFFKNFGLNEANRGILTTRTSRLQNAGNVAKTVLKDMEDSVRRAGNPQQVYERIYRVLETPEYLAKRYGDATKLTVQDLSPAELAAFEKLIRYNKLRNDLNLDTGIINAEQWAKYRDGMHSPRVYDFEALGNPNYETTRYLNLNAAKKRKDITEIDDQIIKMSLESPFQASALRMEQALKNKANMEALKELDAAGLLLNKRPNKNFVRLEGKKYGAAEGKWIDSQILSQFDNKEYFTSKIGQAVGDTVEAYQQSPLGAVDRFMKATKTVLSPGTFGGNLGSNIVAFGGAANVNPVTTATRMAQAAKQLTQHARGEFNPNVHRAELAGLFAGNTGRAITGSREAGSALKDQGANPYKTAQDIYGGADKAFGLGLFNELLARGLTEAEAVRRTHLAMQNYGNVGRVIQTSADSPILGKPFARFIPELVRIMKNRAMYNPVGSVAGLGTVAYGANELSKASGETKEERNARETAVGQTQLPGTGFINSMMTGGEYNNDVSLNIAVPDKIGGIDVPGEGSAVNIARTVGMNSPIEPNGDSNSALLRQLNPFADITRTNAQGEEVIAPNQLVSSLFFKPVADQVANRDFMGREITDPDNKTYFEGDGFKVQKYSDELSSAEQLKNRAGALAMNWLPLANETNAIASAAMDKKDYYGKERTIPQAILRAIGIKTESNTGDRQEERVETQRYFEEDLPAVQNFVKQNPDLAATYFKLKDPSRNRITNQKTSDLITPEKWDIINSDTSGRLFNFLKDQAIAYAKKENKTIDPIYELPEDQMRYVAELRSRPTGDDTEAMEILRATTDWYPAYEDKYFAYLDGFTDREKFEGAADPNPRVAAYEKLSKPIEQPPLIKQYYQIKEQDPEAAKSFYKANKTALSAAFNQYGADRLNRINAMRKIEGYDPISPETFQNKTFGFDADGGGGGSGWGWGGGGGGRTPTVNTLGDLTNFAGDIARLKDIEPQQAPNLEALVQQLLAGRGGGRQKPRLGASSRGQG